MIREASRSGSPHAWSFTAPNPRSSQPLDRLEVGGLVVHQRRPMRRTGATWTRGRLPRPRGAAGRRARAPGPRGRCRSWSAPRAGTATAVLGEQRGHGVAVGASIPDQAGDQRSEGFQRRAVPVAEGVGVVGADPARAVLVLDPDQGRRREDLVLERGVPEPFDVGRQRADLDRARSSTSARSSLEALGNPASLVNSRQPHARVRA